MDANKIIQQGERAKFMVMFDRTDFDSDTMDFHVDLLYGMTGGKLTINKNQFTNLDSSVWLFTFDTSFMAGKVTARMVMEFTDSDVSDNKREEVDEQIICFVATTPCPRFLACPACTGTHDVRYERTEEVDARYRYQQLTDANGLNLTTSDGYNLYVQEEPEEEEEVVEG